MHIPLPFEYATPAPTVSSSYHKNGGVNSFPNCDSADHLGDNRGPLLLSIDKVVGVLVVAQRQILQTFQKTIEIPQLSSFDKVVDVPFVQVVQVPQVQVAQAEIAEVIKIGGSVRDVTVGMRSPRELSVDVVAQSFQDSITVV